jgi:hypothetical protein
MYLVNYGFFYNLVVGIKFETKHHYNLFVGSFSEVKNN